MQDLKRANRWIHFGSISKRGMQGERADYKDSVYLILPPNFLNPFLSAYDPNTPKTRANCNETKTLLLEQKLPKEAMYGLNQKGKCSGCEVTRLQRIWGEGAKRSKEEEGWQPRPE
uniref:Uncharacterized protein n=1 Tax=Micrurus corallinus TaxID=54390 RepID=A0A2D4EUF0_MICCO